jgi:predicted metal-dependent hydrolase
MKSKKSPRIAERIEKHRNGDSPWDPHYLGYFECFNEQAYYEAHDVLEELWLEDRKRKEANFYKGLIQFAGAFVHLQKNRLEPAFRLFLLAENNFAQYESTYEGLSLTDFKALSESFRMKLKASSFTQNPWSPQQAPQLDFPN